MSGKIIIEQSLVSNKSSNLISDFIRDWEALRTDATKVKTTISNLSNELHKLTEDTDALMVKVKKHKAEKEKLREGN